MGRAKAKAKATPEAPKAKKKVKPPKISARNAAASAAKVVLKKDQKEDNVKEGSRKLYRRDTEMTMKRCVRLKLGMFPRHQIDTNVDDNGDLIEKKVLIKLRSLRGTKKHIPLSFWQSIIADHKLTKEILAGLAEPAQKELVNKNLDSALRACHHENPAARNSRQLIRHLEWSGPMNQTEFYGLICGSMEAPSLSSRMSGEMLDAVCKFIARTRMHVAFPQYWVQLKDMFDSVLLSTWRKAQSDSVPRKNFLRAHRLALSLFVEPRPHKSRSASATSARSIPICWSRCSRAASGTRCMLARF